MQKTIHAAEGSVGQLCLEIETGPTSTDIIEFPQETKSEPP